MEKPRTITVPAEKRRIPSDADLIIALQEHGTAVEHALAPRQGTFTVGSWRCDVLIDSPYVSRQHCELERRGHQIHVRDLGSHNGTVFAGQRETEKTITVGEVFEVGITKLVAFDDAMRAARPVLVEILGGDMLGDVDDLLIAAVRGTGPMTTPAPPPRFLLTGEAGAGHDRLARAIHEASPRRSQPRVDGSPGQVATIDTARGGTIVLGVTGKPVDADWLGRVLAPEADVGLVVTAPTLKAAVRSLGVEIAKRLYEVALRPLRERRAQLPALFDRLFEELATTTRWTQLAAVNRNALDRYAWPENLDELREAARRLAAIAERGSMNSAAPVLGVPRSTLQYWAKKLELQLG